MSEQISYLRQAGDLRIPETHPRNSTEQSNQSGLLSRFIEKNKRIINPLTTLVCFSNPIGISLYLSAIFLKETFQKRENGNLNLGERVATLTLGLAIPAVEFYGGYYLFANYFN